MNSIISSVLYDIDEHMLFLSPVKTDHPITAKICLHWKRDSIFKLVYLEEFSSDLSGCGVKI